MIKRDYIHVDQLERERILKKAAGLFRLQGFEKTTVRQIAQACEILPGSLHYRYKSKDQILTDMMQLAIDQTTQAIRSATIDVSDPLQRLRAALHAHVEILLSGNDMVYVLLFEWRSLKGKELKKLIKERDRYEGFWEEMLLEIKNLEYFKKEIDITLLRLLGFGLVNSTCSKPSATRIATFLPFNS